MATVKNDSHCQEVFRSGEFQGMLPKEIHLKELVGSGSFSYVFKATDTLSEEVMAIKCFRMKMLTISHYRYAAKEIAFMKILKHPNIIALKTYNICRNFVYIGTEYAVFGSLKEYLCDRKPVAENKIQCIMSQLLSALDYLHSMGIFHGDIKPENILLMDMTPNGPQIKICDFGLTEVKLKGAGNLFYKSGSFFYMAPEVHLGYPVDCSCDMWSAGLIMYRMMFAKKLFNLTYKDREKFVACLKRRTIPDFSGSDKYSATCTDLVKNLLSYDKQNRYKGTTLRNHTFLNLKAPAALSVAKFVTDANEKITSAFALSNTRKYGSALVNGVQAITELKIHHNLIDNKEQQMFLNQKWEEYQTFCHKMERVLLQPADVELFCPQNPTDEEFRKYLASTPLLLDGFDIGCNAEMFLKEGHKEKALTMFHQCLQSLLPTMKTEPSGTRKEVLGHRIRQWITQLEQLQNELHMVPSGVSKKQ